MVRLLCQKFWTGLSVIALAAAVLRPAPVWATSPELHDISPAGAQRGTELELSFPGARLQDTEEVISYEPGVQVLKLNLVTNNLVKAQIKVAADCRLGEHHFRLRTATGLSELHTLLIGPFPTIEEVEPNDEPAKAQKIRLNHTVSGVIKREDVDCFSVELKKGQRFSAEVEGMRLGRGDFDGRLAVLGPDGSTLADVDDTWLARQDPLVTLLAPTDGVYIIKLREATYGGNDNCHYRLHLGTFPRPIAIFPPGGKTGESLPFVFYSETTGAFTNEIKLPETAQDEFGVFAELEHVTAPTPNWVRVSDFPNVLAAASCTNQEHATATDLRPPFAFNGILARKGEENWLRFPVQKGLPLNVTVFARRLRSPLDSVLEIRDLKGNVLAANDDTSGPDSSLKFRPSESTNYFLRIRDTLGQGGPDFVYRVEITPEGPGLTVKIPDVARNDTQSRQYIAVPRGNRFATLISARRSNFGGELDFSIKDLPPGVTLVTNRLAANQDALPLVFEAAPDAPLGCKLLDLVGSGTNGSTSVSATFHQDIDLVQGVPNNASYFSTRVDKLCVAVTREAPFKLRIIEPKVPLVQSGSMPLEIAAERAPGFETPIEVHMIWNPPGVSEQPEVTIPKGASNVIYTLNANGGAETRTWKIAVLGHATVDGGELYVSSQLADLQVATPYLSGKIETLWVNPGKTGKLTLNLQHAKPFEGKASVTLAGLPEKVTAAPIEITKDDQEATFDVVVDPACRTGSHKNLFCTVQLKDQGVVVPHVIAQGGIIRIVPPKKSGATVAAAEKKK